MKKKGLEKKLEGELKDVIALLRGIDLSKEKFFPEEEYEKVCIEGLKQGREILEKLTDEKAKDDLFSEIIEAEYDLAGRLVKKEQYGKAIKHFQNLNQIGIEFHKKFDKIVSNKDFNLEFTRKRKELSKKYPGIDTDTLEKYAMEAAEIEKPFNFNREAKKLIFCTHLSLAYIHALKRDIRKVVDETIEALKWVNSDANVLYIGVDVREFVPFNLRKSYHRRSWFRKIHEFGIGHIEEDAYVAIFGMSKEKLDRLSDRIFEINRPKINPFQTFRDPLNPFDDPFKPNITFDPPTYKEPFKLNIPKIEEFKFRDSSARGRHKEEVSNRREYCKELMCLVLLDNKFQVNEKTLNTAYQIIATDPTDLGNYLLLMVLLGQEGKKKEKQAVMNEVVRLISTKSSIKDYDSESINSNYKSVLKAGRYVSKPESEETAKKQHILSNFFLKYAKDKDMFAKSYGYAEGIDGKFYLVTELLNKDNLSTFDVVLGKSKDEDEEEKLKQAIDILVEMQKIYGKNGSKLHKEIGLFSMDFQGIFKDKIIGRLKPTKNKQKLEEAVQFLIKEIDSQEKCFSHGDYHSENIIKTGKRKLASIDFSYAGFIPMLYDVVFLLEDPKLELDDSIKEQTIKYFLEKKGKKLDKFWKKKLDYMSLFVNLRWAGVSSKWQDITNEKKYNENKIKNSKKSEKIIDKMLTYTSGSEYSNLQNLKTCLKELYQ